MKWRTSLEWRSIATNLRGSPMKQVFCIERNPAYARARSIGTATTALRTIPMNVTCQ